MQTNTQVTFINPETMPKSNGYSHVAEVRNARTIYVSGQIALNPEGK